MYLMDRKVHDAVVDQIGKAIDSKGKPGFVRIYSGPMPVSPEDEPTGRLLAEFECSLPSFKPTVDGVTASNILVGATGLSEGVATWARICDADGIAAFDCDVGRPESDAVVRLSSTNFNVGRQVGIDSIVIVMPRRA